MSTLRDILIIIGILLALAAGFYAFQLLVLIFVGVAIYVLIKVYRTISKPPEA